MSKKYLLLFFICLTFYNTSLGYEQINKTYKINSIETNCNGADVKTNLYLLGNSEDYLYLRDNFINRENDLLQISNDDTEINYFTSENGLISIENNVPIENNFIRASWVAPENIPVRAIETLNKTFFHIPQNKSNNKVQFVYKIAFKEQTGFKSGTSQYDYYEISNINDMSSNGKNGKEVYLSNNQKRNWGNVKKHSNECITYNLQWCGDNIKNGTEECDGTANCDATCKVIQGSCSSLTYARYNNDYTFTCSGSTIGSAKITNYKIYNTKTGIGTESSSGTVTVPGITTDETYSCDVEVDGKWVTETAKAPSCLRNTNTFSCSSLTDVRTLPINSNQNLNSTAQKTNINTIIKNHTLEVNGSGASVIDGDKTIAVHPNINIGYNKYEALIHDNYGNNASSSGCSFVLTSTSNDICTSGTITLDKIADLKEDTPGLCANTAKVTNFNKSVPDADGKITYTWECGGLSGGDCNITGGSIGGSKSCSDFINPIYKSKNIILTKEMDLCNITGNGKPLDFKENKIGNTINYTWQCAYGVGYCSDSYTNTGTTIITGGSTCGDGTKEPTETCDYNDGSKSGWLNGTYCSSKCDYSNDIICEPDGFGETKYTMGWNSFTPWKDFYMKNVSDKKAINITNGQLCIKSENPELITLSSPSDNYSTDRNEVCTKTIFEILPVDASFIIPEAKYKTASWIDNAKSKEATLTLYIKGDVQDVPKEYTKKTYKITIVRSTIQNFGGGASFLKNTVSDISELGGNKNMVMSNIGGELSNYAGKSITGETANDIQKSQTDKLSKIKEKDTDKGNNYINGLPTEKFNNFDNVFISKKIVNIDAVTINENTTYIVDGNLNINGNIKSNKSVLFVTRGGKITIGANVEKIDAILISLPKNGVTDSGNIKSDLTDKQLSINGALYGDLKELIANRTHISIDGDKVKVGTNVNFTSKVFSNPPPLLSKFLGSYMDAQRVAK